MTTLWNGDGHGWKQELPHLPDDVIALLAAPVVVSANSFGTAHDVDAWPVEPTVAAILAPEHGDASIARLLTPVPARGERRARARV
jgi:hypothetical protein